MNSLTMKRAVAIGIAGAIAFGATTPVWAAPVSSNTAAVKNAIATDVIDVRNRGRAWGAGPAVALGAIGVIGAVGALSAAQSGYYGGPEYYGSGYGPGYGPSYDPGYAYEAPYDQGPVYYAPRYRQGSCRTDEGYGRRGSCDR